jgi:hypothetical protein
MGYFAPTLILQPLPEVVAHARRYDHAYVPEHNADAQAWFWTAPRLRPRLPNAHQAAHPAPEQKNWAQ